MRRRAALSMTSLAIALTFAASALSKQPAPSADSEPISTVGKRPVQTVRLAPSGADGQTSWIIEPDVPRIPKIKGVELRLPPHIERRLSRAFDLAQRGATYSANSEFQEVLALCALELDAREGVTSHREALRQGLVALSEADDLSGNRIDWQDAADVRSAVAGHSTPVMRDASAPIDSIAVVQRYFTYAEERLTYACAGLPSASLAYYGLARTYVQAGTHYNHAAGKSAMMQGVALRLEPRNVLAANELGVLLAQHGHLSAAESLFKQCVATDATPEAWQNLAAVYARQGRAEASQAARLASSQLAATKNSSNVTPLGPSPDSTAPAAPIQDAVAQSASTATEDTTLSTEPEDERQGFWQRIELSQKLQSVFRR